MTAPDIITVDVEEWFHGHNYLDHVPPASWDEQESRVRIGTARCLEMLDRHPAKATFFVLGKFAQAPILQHLRMQEVLIDRGQLVFQRLVEIADDFFVTLHVLLLWCIGMGIGSVSGF